MPRDTVRTPRSSSQTPSSARSSTSVSSDPGVALKSSLPQGFAVAGEIQSSSTSPDPRHQAQRPSKKSRSGRPKDDALPRKKARSKDGQLAISPKGHRSDRPKRKDRKGGATEVPDGSTPAAASSGSSSSVASQERKVKAGAATPVPKVSGKRGHSKEKLSSTAQDSSSATPLRKGTGSVASGSGSTASASPAKRKSKKSRRETAPQEKANFPGKSEQGASEKGKTKHGIRDAKAGASAGPLPPSVSPHLWSDVERLNPGCCDPFSESSVPQVPQSWTQAGELPFGSETLFPEIGGVAAAPGGARQVPAATTTSTAPQLLPRVVKPASLKRQEGSSTSSASSGSRSSVETQKSGAVPGAIGAGTRRKEKAEGASSTSGTAGSVSREGGQPRKARSGKRSGTSSATRKASRGSTGAP